MRISAIAALLTVASCAAVAPSSAPVPVSSASGGATVLAVRPIAAAASGQGAAWRSLLLDGAAGTARPEGSQPPAIALAEFIVREDAGATISIVQSNATGLRAGDRVLVTHPPASAGRASLGRLL